MGHRYFHYFNFTYFRDNFLYLLETIRGKYEVWTHSFLRGKSHCHIHKEVKMLPYLRQIGGTLAIETKKGVAPQKIVVNSSFENIMSKQPTFNKTKRKINRVTLSIRNHTQRSTCH